jgi:hypothetical protein
VDVGIQTVSCWPSEYTRISQWPATVTVSQAVGACVDVAGWAPPPFVVGPGQDPGGAAAAGAEERGSGVGVSEPGSGGAGGGGGGAGYAAPGTAGGALGTYTGYADG